MSGLIEKTATFLLVLAALVMTGSTVYKSHFAGSGSKTGAPPGHQALDYVDRWEDALSIGTRVAGDEAAPVKIVTLFDLECPVCRVFHEVVSSVVAARPHDVQLVYVNYPLNYHTFATPAARAGVCAEEVGAFPRWADVVYAKQDSLGLKSWGTYALEAEIADTVRIHQCATTSVTMTPIEAGLAFGSRIGIHGTPTVIINGWRYSQTPTEAELNTAIGAIMSGARPN